MEYDVTITIPKKLEPQLRLLENFNTFVNRITIQALQNLDKLEKHDHKHQMAKAAQLMLADYSEDKELTAFTDLDGEPFYE